MSDASGFGKFVPGFEFLQNLAGQAAGGVAQGLGKSLPQMPNLGHWVAPTFNVEDLEKRIEELKAVQFWLDQNAKALSATIQALEVQKMSLATLKAMNFNLGDVANALKVKAAETVSGFAGKLPTQFAGLEIPERTYGNPAAAPAEAEAEAEAEPDEEPEEAPEPPKKPRKTASPKADAPAAAAPGVVDPMAWWGALSQQFQQIASTAMKDMAKQGALDATRHVASDLTEQAVKTAADMAAKAGRSVGDSVARNVGRAAGMGSAAVRAVAGAGRKKPAAAPKKPVAKVAVKKVAPKRATKTAAPTPAQPMGAGDWPMPTAFFPGFMPTPAKSAPKAPAKKAPAAQKAPAKKTTTRRR
ncbi:PhaM family polyhydroxyalkanoate granule multifunctional regulatory protein [Hydrogenophaga sp. RWCD_12]|uniref:PhaM family polyhydroxyalkanoate granule multifunctional regulatory protein n=1 Tax=Hydrogenophaga sp. RWCD_12 TaxID=3391190 RepID=UPI0039849238